MGSHDLFVHLKHKLCPKEGSGVKLTIWLLITKSQESFWFPCVQVVCHIPLESSRRKLQLCFIPHFNQRSTQNLMGPQSRKKPNFGNFKTPIWESRDKMTFGCWSHGQAQSISYKGEGSGFPQVWAMVSLMSLCLHVARSCTKVLQLRINQLVIWFV
jgi:hypothetical protein